jgi:hypothetical protein
MSGELPERGMNRIVREHYPVDRLPADLRAGLPAGEEVTVAIELGGHDASTSLEIANPVLTLDEIFALRRPPFRSVDDINDGLRRDRDEWDE